MVRYLVKEWQESFIVKQFNAWLANLNSPGVDNWLKYTVVGNKQMMHTLVMDLQIILHASWWSILGNMRLLKQVKSDTPILNKDTFEHAKAPVAKVLQNLRSTIYGVDNCYHKPVATWYWYKSQTDDGSNLQSSTTYSSPAVSNVATQPTNNTARDTGPRRSSTISPTEQQRITRAKQEGLIITTTTKPQHFANAFATFGGIHMCTNFVTENLYCRSQHGQCRFAHITSFKSLNQQDQAAMIAWVDSNPNVKWRPGKGPSTSRGNN